MEIFETELKEYAEKIKNLTVKVEKMEKDTDDYNAADMDGVKVEIKQVEALIKELQLSIGGSSTVFQSLRAQVSLEYDGNPIYHIKAIHWQTTYFPLDLSHG